MRVGEIILLLAKHASTVRVRCDAGAFVGNFAVKCTKKSLLDCLARLPLHSEVPAHFSNADRVLTVGWDR